MTRPQNHREELHQINFIIKWEAAASNAQSRRRRRLWFTLRITQCLRSLSGLSGCGSADTIMNPRSLSKHCRRGLSHVCNVNWKPSWMSNQNYRKENRLFFWTSIRESLWTSRKSLEMVILRLKLTVSINDKPVWSHCRNQNTSQSALHFKHFVFGIKWCWNWRRLHLPKYKLFSIISSSAFSWSPKTAHFERLFIWQTHSKPWSVWCVCLITEHLQRWCVSRNMDQTMSTQLIPTHRGQ